MANDNTFVNGFTAGSEQITTLSQIQGAGLKIPSAEFINIRAPGKLEVLFNNNGNANRIYGTNKPQDVGLSDVLKNRFDYKNPNQGQRSRITSRIGFAAQDVKLVAKFLGSNKGFQFIGKQLILQGFQAFDETKVYNPASPLIAALKPASFGLLDSPTRHLDTSNIVGGVINGLGLGGVVSTIGGLFGSAPPSTPPPRSSVASAASRPGGFLGINAGTFSSMIGGGDRTDEVVTSIARNDVKDLLRGNTATSAYNAPRYNRWLSSSSSKGFFSNLLTAAGKFIQNKTLIGGILPPKQPWAANYRADEKTYDLMMNANKLFSPSSTGIGGGGILSGLLNSIGFGKKASYSQAVPQRFYNKSDNATNAVRLIITSNFTKGGSKSRTFDTTDEIGKYDGSGPLLSNSEKIVFEKTNVSAKDNSLKYGDLVGVDNNGAEKSDQLLNYKSLIKNTKNFSDTFSDLNNNNVEKIRADLLVSQERIIGASGEKYDGGYKFKKNLYPLQFIGDTPEVGFTYLNKVDPTQKLSKNPTENKTYQGRFLSDETTGEWSVPTRLGARAKDRYIRPTNNVDYVNSLEVLSQKNFEEQYSATKEYGKFGPDIIKFYFYDIINQTYIPFNATVKSITDNNQAEWETIEYLGRPDKLYYYKGFTRNINFNFSVVAHSIKELMPMWNRINYLVGLTRPSNYTMQAKGGFMISPMVQLTLGDFYKNHNVVIKTCNVTIPDDASWETIQEDVPVGQSWNYGPNRALEWRYGALNSSAETVKVTSTGRFAQFPREANIQIEMGVLEKDRPKTGRAIWGDAPVLNINGVDSYGTYDSKTNEMSFNLKNDFSTKIRYDTDILALARAIKENEAKKK